MAADHSVSAKRAGRNKSTPITSPYFFWNGSIIVMKFSPRITLAKPNPPGNKMLRIKNIKAKNGVLTIISLNFLEFRLNC